MRVIGIDPGSIKMGYGLIDVVSGFHAYVAAGTISAPESWRPQRRYVELWRELNEVLDEYRPDTAGVEAGFVKNQQGALVSGAARGLAMLALGIRGIAATEYQPSTVKKAATGHGAAKKPQVAAMMKLQLKLAREPEPDAADALAVALCRATDLAAKRSL